MNQKKECSKKFIGTRKKIKEIIQIENQTLAFHLMTFMTTNEISVNKNKISFVSVLALKDFSVELFHPDHGSQDKYAVILQQKDPSV